MKTARNRMISISLYSITTTTSNNPWPDHVILLIGSDVDNYSSDVSNNNNNSPLARSRQSSERTFVNKLGLITLWPGTGVALGIASWSQTQVITGKHHPRAR